MDWYIQILDYNSLPKNQQPLWDTLLRSEVLVHTHLQKNAWFSHKVFHFRPLYWFTMIHRASPDWVVRFCVTHPNSVTNMMKQSLTKKPAMENPEVWNGCTYQTAAHMHSSLLGCFISDPYMDSPWFTVLAQIEWWNFVWTHPNSVTNMIKIWFHLPINDGRPLRSEMVVLTQLQHTCTVLS